VASTLSEPPEIRPLKSEKGLLHLAGSDKHKAEKALRKMAQPWPSSKVQKQLTE
jgi:hypothetical protein